jgi:hypothetical protein
MEIFGCLINDFLLKTTVRLQFQMLVVVDDF